MADAQRRAELILEFKDNLSAGANAAAGSLGKVDSSSQKLNATAAATEQQFGKLAAQLNNGTKTAAAQASIGQLDGLLKSGKISADQYGSALGQIQLQSGLASKGSMEAADSIMNLGKQFAAGKITSDQYAAGIKNIQSELNSSQNIFQKFGGAIMGAKEILLGVAAAAGIAAAAIGAMKAAFDFAAEGATLNRLADGFENLGNSEADLNKLRQASIGTISDENLMMQANRAQLLMVTDSTDELAKLLQVAAVRGRAMGISTTQAFGDIVTGIGRLSPKILDNIGIITEAEVTYANYAKSIGKTADSLSDAEKRQALVNKVISEGAKLGPMLDDQASKFERLQTKLDNLGNSLKSFAADAMTPVLQRGEDFGTLYDNNAKAVDRLSAAERLNSDALSGLQGRLEGVIVGLKQQAEAEQSAATGTQAYADVLYGEMIPAVQASVEEFDTLQDRLEATQHILSPLELGMKALAEAHYEGGDASRAWNDALKDHKKVMDEAAEADEKALISAANYAIQNSKFVESFKDFSALEGAKTTIANLEEAMRANPENRENYAAKIRLIKTEFGLITPEMEAAAETFQKLEGMWMSGALSTETYALAMGKIQQAAKDGKVSVDELGLKTGEAAAFMATSAATAKTEQEGIVNDARSTKERLMDEMGNALGEQQTVLQGKISESMLSIANSMVTAQSLANTTTENISQAWGRVPTVVTTTYIIKTQGSVPSGATQSKPSGHAAGGIIAGAMGMIARGPTYLVGEGNYQTFAGQGAEGVIPLNDRGINILAEALSRAMERMPSSTTNVYASPGVDIITKVSQGLAAQTRQAKRAGAGAMGR